MADYDVYQSLETEQEFFEELDDVVGTQYQSHDLIDETLRSWLYLASMFRDKFCDAEDDIAACAQKLLASQLFVDNRDYVRTQIIFSLLQEDEPNSLYLITCFLLLDGRADEATFTRMVEEACFPRLLELINGRKDRDPRLHRLLLELMYEMSRIERLRTEDLLQIDDGFINYLFQIIEELSNDVHDPYHYPIIRVLLVLNEQYMLSSTNIGTDPLAPSAPLTNRVIKCLSLHGDSFRTFGENIILLLNRETETSQQLLILKLLYLLFTTKATHEYFYTNDLKVLLDVIIRNLMDLPDEKASLRHTYLRVLYPLLAHTQLSHPPHYKRDEVHKVLRILGGFGNSHFAPADETTVRLVERVSKVKWLAAPDEDAAAAASGEAEVARKFLGISLSPSQTASSISVVDVAAVMEKPGVQTPSRRAEAGGEAAAAAGTAAAKRIRPEVPRHRHGLPFAGIGTGKKTPPKAPPPRRHAKLRIVETPPDGGPASDV
ncbi:LDB17 [Verticillium alfalfae VaMs.102]|uniref:LDB17 n=1 Tax=Verticillium alfalfae (strain VaMs.102 / ATCC MYA-4576 / FGSC 10136) TaxID=526221 RepID=C9SXU1_VERA1|nr:LDB17 [Verticillium alfalfae VaMs.102]EEY23606.1 LDB17 [Verticillium alfalfae VaMs.102]